MLAYWRGQSYQNSDFQILTSYVKLPAGHVLVTFPEPYNKWSVVHESSLNLVDRVLSFGDVVKRSPSDTESGTVVRTTVECTLEPVSAKYVSSQGHESNHETKEYILYNIPGEELKYTEDYQEGDYIIYHDALGVVKSTTEEVTVRLEDGAIVVVEDSMDLEVSTYNYRQSSNHSSLVDLLRESYEFSTSANLSDKKDLKPPAFLYPGLTVVTTKVNLRRGKWDYGEYNPSIYPRVTVMDVRLTGIEVAWLSANSFSADQPQYTHSPTLLDEDELGSGRVTKYERGKFPPGSLPNSYGSTQGSSIALGDHVRFRDVADAAVKYDRPKAAAGVRQNQNFYWIPRTATQGYDMNVFAVRGTKTKLIVQWQDTSTTEEDSTSLIPYINVDEHDVWPGEIVELPEARNLNPSNSIVDTPSTVTASRRIGVVQSTSARERLARVRWFSDSKVEFIDDSILMPGSSVGILTAEETEVSLFEVKTVPGLTRRRGDIVLISSTRPWLETLRRFVDVPPRFGTLLFGNQFRTLIALARSLLVPDAKESLEGPSAAKLVRSADELIPQGVVETNVPQELTWIGEVINLELDGRLKIRLGALPQARDITIPIESAFLVLDEDDDSFESLLGSSIEEQSTDDFGISDMMSDSGVESYEETIEYEGGERLDAGDEDEVWMTEEEDGQDGIISGTSAIPVNDTETDTKDCDSRPTESLISRLGVREPQSSNHLEMPSRFAIIDDTAPVDHHFIAQRIQLSANLMRRIRKEHRVLEPSLPDGTWVRTWADRLDLLRVLILGPRGTPYELVPFIMDFQFGINFPNSPPAAYFHSWTGGLGRINPNLYEDGKICLSLLGTWPGESHTEDWSPTHSSMLQIVVSLMGLVLVKEPYYSK